MESQKDKPVIANRRAPQESRSTFWDNVHVVRSDLTRASDLSIADDVDHGGDPYNSTGQHCIIKQKQKQNPASGE